MNQIDFNKNTINGIHSFLIEYYGLIKNGGWIAGRELKATLEYLINDLEKYDFDSKKAHKRIKHIETYCVQSKSRFHGKPIKLMKWQKALIEVIYSFKVKNKSKRRFEEVLLMVARKNGKSTFVSSEVNIEFFIGPGGQDICCSSNDDRQANLIFDQVDKMRQTMDPKDRFTKRNQKGLFHKTKYSKVFKISDRTRNKDGFQIQLAAIDEIHEMKDNEIFMAIKQSQSIEENPLIYEITTEGMIEDGYLDKRLSYARKVVKREIIDESLLFWPYTQDSIEEVFQDESSWWKSNPSLGEVKQWDFLRKGVDKARVSREDRAMILCKDFNIKQNKAISWLLEEEINRNKDTFDLEDFKGAYYIGGVDISETTDLTAAAFMFQKDKKNYFHIMYFIPEAKARGEKNTNLEDKDYFKWQEQGLVRIVSGNEVDTKSINQYQWELYERYQIRPFRCGYDNWMAKDFVSVIKEDFGDEIPERVRMDFMSLSTPMRSLSADIKDGNVIYQNNPITRWCLKNTAIKSNNMNQIMPIKVYGSGNRIDGSLAMMIAYHVRSKYKSEFDALTGGD